MSGGSPEHPPELIERIRLLWLDKATSGEISRLVKLTRSAVMSIVSRGRDRDGSDAWPERKKGPRAFQAKLPKKPMPIKKRLVAPHSAERPKTVFTTAQRLAVNPEPSRPQAKPIRFSERKSFECAFIAGEPTADAMCCGSRTVEGKSYCAYHLKLVTAHIRDRGHFRLQSLEAA